MTTTPPTLDQVLRITHWHPCDLDTHTLEHCVSDSNHAHALAWGADILSLATLLALLCVIIFPLVRAVSAGAIRGRRLNAAPGERSAR